MPTPDADALARRLRSCRTGTQVHQLRQMLTPEQAKAAIQHPSFTPVDRAAIALARAFRCGNPRWDHFDSEVIWDDLSSEDSVQYPEAQ